MWCRVLLLVIALTYVLCVIYLSGLQKEDLGEDLLQKLQRHNVNINDLNDEKTTRKCSRSSSSENPKINISRSTKDTPQTASDRPNKTSPRKENLNTEKTANHSETPKVIQVPYDRDQNAEALQNENITAKNTNNNMTVPLITFNKEIKDIDLINELLRGYISATQLIMTTPKPKIILKSHHTNEIKRDENTNNNPRFTRDEKSVLCRNNSILFGLLKQYQNLSDVIKCNSEEDKQANSSQSTQTNRIPISFLNIETETDPSSINMEFMRKMIEKYVAEKLLTTTLKPTTTQDDIDSISQRIKKLIENNNIDYNNGFIKRVSELFNKVNTTSNINEQISRVVERDSILNELLIQKSQLNQSGPLNRQDREFQNPRTVKTGSNLNEQVTVAIPIETDSRSISIDDIKKIIDRYIEAKTTFTTTRNPTEKQNEISEKIKEFLKTNNNYNNNNQPNHISELYENNKDSVNDLHKTNSVKLGKHNMGAGQYISEPVNTKESSNIGDSIIVQRKNDSSMKIPVSQLKHINIYEIFESYLAQTTTTRATTPQKQIDIISQRIKEFLENNTSSLVTQVLEPIKKQNTQTFKYPNIDNEQLFYARKTDINEFPSQTYYMNVSDSLNSNPKKTELLNDTIQNIEKSRSDINTIPIAQTQPVSDDIIRDIMQKLKKSILEDLRKQMASTLEATTIEHTTETATTITLLQIDPEKVKAATSALENVIELFQQLKKVKESAADSKYTLTQKKNTKNEFHGPINVLYPPLLPADYAYVVNAQTTKAMPIFVNRYQYLNIDNHVLQTADTMKQRKNEQSKARLEELSSFNLNPNKMYDRSTLQSAAIIQTDAEEVPLLGIPVPNSVRAINQNIILTKHPMLQFKEEQKHRSFINGHKPRYQNYEGRNKEIFGNGEKQSNTFRERMYRTDLERQSESEMEGRHNTDIEKYSDTDMERRYTELDIQSNTDVQNRFHSELERTYGHRNWNLQHGRHPKPAHQSKTIHRSKKSRDRQSLNIDKPYREYSKARPNSSNRDHSILHPRERFHVKLETPIENQSRVEEHQSFTEDDNKRLKVASRQQLSLNKIRKKSSYDDHFKNFLKTQEKVNNMLEKILAKNVHDRVRSVETPDTMHSFVN